MDLLIKIATSEFIRGPNFFYISRMKLDSIIIILALGCTISSGCNETAKNSAVLDTPVPPNIVIILADDLGYGDVAAFNRESKIKTPHLNALAASGMSFTDAHSNSSVCTPTRYGLLTGEYAWRSRMKQGVLLGYSPSLIPEDKSTLASMLKNQGYYTACIGKWHLGLDWKLKDSTYLTFPQGQPVSQELRAFKTYDLLDFSAPVKGGPAGAGFDYSFIIPASLDFEPYCYLENNTLVEPLDAETAGSDLDTGYTGAFWRPGKMSASFVHEEVLPTFIDKGVDFIKSREQNEQPFLLYLPLNAPHTPWLPTKDFAGNSETGTYGDFVEMVDYEVGRILQQLQTSGFEQNSLVIFASDNGAYWKDDFIEKYQHRSNYNFRGMKADIFDGGHRVPLIVKWPGMVKEESLNDQTLCLTDIFSTIKDVIKAEQVPKPGDSFSFYSILTGEASDIQRPPVIHHSSRGMFAIRSGDWKWIEGLGSGGFSEPVSIPQEDGMPAGQLYNLRQDLAETDNQYFKQKELADSLDSLLEEIRQL
ncbi:MAG: arylsulfatase [Cyclobacteriaceae bacterium]|nr:MAG: arylsulfatase [Cyclobacteriaceae bacterium]